MVKSLFEQIDSGMLEGGVIEINLTGRENPGEEIVKLKTYLFQRGYRITRTLKDDKGEPFYHIHFSRR